MLTTHETSLYRRTVFANFRSRFSSYFIIIKSFFLKEKKTLGAYQMPRRNSDRYLGYKDEWDAKIDNCKNL